MELPPISAAERTPLVEALLAIIDALRQRIAFLEELVQQLRDEIMILKGQKPRPKIQPSQLETSSSAASGMPPADRGKRPGSSKRRKRVSMPPPKEITIPFPDPPPGSTTHGFESYDVQELRIEVEYTRYPRERIRMPDGTTRLAPLPCAVMPGRHFGPELIGYILNQHHQCGVTQPLLVEQLREFGIAISTGQLNRILTENLEPFHAEKAELLPAALTASLYIGVDDTGARHQGRNGYCTALGNDLFGYFASTDSKSRLNFLRVLRGGSEGYAVNEVARAYWEKQGLARELRDRLGAGPRCFADATAWQAWLGECAAGTERAVRIASEGGLLGQLIEQGVSPQLVILSDGAPQFDLLVHASCWIHAERPLARMVPYCEAHRVAIEAVRHELWELYQALKAYRARPDPTRAAVLEAGFDALVSRPTAYPASIGAALQEMRAHKADLLRVLTRPEVPLHNNGTESIIRGYAKIRKISGSTRSDAGRRCRDTFASLKKTCRKLRVGFWEYLKDRIRGLGTIPRLAELIRRRAATARAPGRVDAVPA